MNERIKKLRRSLDLTQQEFAKRIGTARNNIAGYETGKRSPSEAVITLICREFDVNEEWLRTGKGEMSAPKPTFDLGEYAKRHGMTALETEILMAYLELDPNLRENLLQHFKDRLSAEQKAVAPAPPAPAVTPAPVEADTERENFLKTAAAQYDSEKEPDTPASSVSESGVV